MLAKRIIPCLDVTGGRVVKGVNFVELRDAGDPVEIAAIAVMSLVLSFIATLYPAMKAAGTDPVQVLRYE